MASKKRAKAMCDISGFVYPMRVMRLNSYGLLVGPLDYDGQYDLNTLVISSEEVVYNLPERMRKFEEAVEIDKNVVIGKAQADFDAIQNVENAKLDNLRMNEISKVLENIEKVKINPSLIQPSKEIKSLGNFDVLINLHSEVQTQIVIKTVPQEESQ